MAVRSGRLGGAGQCDAEDRVGPDHRVEIEHRGHLLGQRLKFVAARLDPGGAAQSAHQPFGRDRLDQIVGRPGAHRLDRQQRAGTGGQHQNRQRGAALLEFGNQVARGIAWHPLVENDGGQLHALPRAQRGDRGFGIVDDQRTPAVAGGERGDEAALRRLVVDQH